MTCTATAINFYAPMERGPGNPNSLYFGSDVLYRSTDAGVTMTKVSQEPIVSGVAIAAIGISPQNDNIRVVGLNNGGLFGTITGATTLVDFDPSNLVVGAAINRIVIDPNNSTTAYVAVSTFSFAGVVYKTTNLGNAGGTTWTNITGTGATGLPLVPTDQIIVDPLSSNTVYAGTDIGVYMSTDAGATWTPFGTGLPRVAVFDMKITANRMLRIATHGRGIWEIAAIAPSFEADVQTRPSGDGIIDDSDIQQIRRFSIGLDTPYQSNEFQRADSSPRGTSGDGDVDDGDIQQVRRYAIGLDPKQIAAGQTSPNPIAPPVLSKSSIGSIKGKTSVITGNSVQAAPAAFRIDAQNTGAGSTLVVPIRVDTVGNEAGYTFSIAFDSAKLTNPNVVIGDSGGDVLFNANNAGQIGFSVTTFTGGTIAAGNNKTLVTVTFTVAAGAAAGTTQITFTDTPARRKASPVDPNFPITQPTYTGGTITIGAATAAGASLSGRVLSGTGRGIANARVIITNSAGEVAATARTNGFGYYRIAEIESGAAYIVRVESKQYKFDARTINVAQDLDGVDFTAQPR